MQIVQACNSSCPLPLPEIDACNKELPIFRSSYLASMLLQGIWLVLKSWARSPGLNYILQASHLFIRLPRCIFNISIAFSTKCSVAWILIYGTVGDVNHGKMYVRLHCEIRFVSFWWQKRYLRRNTKTKRPEVHKHLCLGLQTRRNKSW